MSGHVRKLPPIQLDWRTAHADKLDAEAATIATALEANGEAEAMLVARGDDELAAHIRGLCGHLRTKRNDLTQEAGRLRAAQQDASHADREAV